MPASETPPTFPLLFSAGKERDECRAAGCPRSVPWSFMAPHEAWAQQNHGQTLRRLAERGGLGVQEMLAVVLGQRWRDRTTRSEIEGVPELLRLLAEHATEVTQDMNNPSQ